MMHIKKYSFDCKPKYAETQKTVKRVFFEIFFSTRNIFVLPAARKKISPASCHAGEMCRHLRRVHKQK
jgi:hypothetical protein